ncbi:MAG: hypothetical protein MI976_15260 [Pseudomonadales bacterium]|nr:hypothetical protein [Pseudomonadales bacterium]
MSKVQASDAVGLWSGEYDSSDSIGQSNASIVGDIEYAPGKLGQAFLLDGSGYLEIPTISEFSADRFTFHLWIRAELSNQRDIPLLLLGYERGDTSVHIKSNGSMCVRIQWRHGGCTFGTGSNTIRNNELAHITIVKNQGSLRIFKNGVLVGSGSGSCCLPITTSLYFGGTRIQDRGVTLMLDEITYSASALSDSEVAALFNEFINSNPDHQLLAELEEAYTLIDSFQEQIENLAVSNTELENQVTYLEQKNTLSASEIFALEAQVDQLENQVHQLENQLRDLDSKVASLDHEVAELKQHIAVLNDLISSLNMQVAYLEEQVDALQIELNYLKQLLTSSLARLVEDFRDTFNDPQFIIPGDSSDVQLDHLIDVIIDLNKGRKMGLYKSLNSIR